MDWYVQYRKDGRALIERRSTPEGAIEAACQLIDDGSDVYGIGTGELADSISRDVIVQIYDLWAMAKSPVGKTSSGKATFKPPSGGQV